MIAVQWRNTRRSEREGNFGGAGAGIRLRIIFPVAARCRTRFMP